MASKESRWTLEDLIDLEQAASLNAPISQATREAVVAVARGEDSAVARRAGLRIWLDACEEKSAGRKFSAGLIILGVVLAILLFLTGISSVLGMLDRERGGIHVSLFLGLLIGGQWLVILVAVLIMAGTVLRNGPANEVSMGLLRKGLKTGPWRVVRLPFSRTVQRSIPAYAGFAERILGSLARRISGQQDATWWGRLMDGNGPAKAALLWRLARLAQAAGVFFNLGLIVGLAGLVMVKHIGFYWETTTEATMREVLEKVVNFLSAPWAIWWPGAVPSVAVIESSRYFPGQTGALAPGPGAWWEFLLMSLLVWGLLPRATLWLLAWFSENRALAQLDFQARHHRALWRELTGQQRAASTGKPLDGVLVLDVGGCGLSELVLRPFLLRRLRVNPTAWRSTAVLDTGAEDEAARSLALAPAGVVLLVEGWSLSIPRMAALHAKIRASAGKETPVKFFVVNVGPDLQPLTPTPDEQREWTRFVDSLRDPAAEVFFYEITVGV